MGNSQTLKSHPASTDPGNFPEILAESAESSASIDFSILPLNKIEINPMILDDSFGSEQNSSPQSSDLNNCFKNSNCVTSMPRKFAQENEKEAFALQKAVIDAVCSVLMEQDNEICEIPEDCFYSDI